MNRRNFISAIVPGLAAAGSFGFAAKPIDAPKPIKKYGVLTVDGHRAHKATTGENLHVYVDGVDVTNIGCFEADDVAGYALIFCRDEQEHRRWDAKGARHIDRKHGGACAMRLTGNVLITPGPKL